MKRQIFLYLTFFSAPIITISQRLDWDSSPAVISIMNKIAGDSFGNVITIGRFHGIIDFDPGSDLIYLRELETINNNLLHYLKVKNNNN